MFKRTIKYILVISALLSPGAYFVFKKYFPKETKVTPKDKGVEVTIILNDTNASQNVEINVDDLIKVNLLEDSTHHLKWVYVPESNNSLSLVGETKTVYSDSVERSFSFKAKIPSSNQIMFSYGPFAHEVDESIKTIEFFINVS